MPGPTLDSATTGDMLSPADLQRSFDWLMAQAQALDDAVSAAPDVPAAQDIGRTQEALRQRARALVARQIDLTVGQARITADHIDSAVAFANGVIRQIADVKKKLQKLGQVLDFFAAVLTGQGDQIVAAAVTLKDALEQA